jgi:hypothetical protein
MNQPIAWSATSGTNFHRKRDTSAWAPQRGTSAWGGARWIGRRRLDRVLLADGSLAEDGDTLHGIFDLAPDGADLSLVLRPGETGTWLALRRART